MVEAYAKFDVDSNRLIDNIDETIRGRFEEESGWLNESGIFLKSSFLIASDTENNWDKYIAFLIDWAIEHQDEAFERMSPPCYDEWLENEAQEDSYE